MPEHTLENSISAHRWHVRTTDVWCVTGAQCVSGATIAADFKHQVPVILIQMGGAWVAPGARNLMHALGACDAQQICGAYMSLVCRDQIPIPPGINLVQTVAPDWVTDGPGLDYNTCGNRIESS